jgi:hypothetical protein
MLQPLISDYKQAVLDAANSFKDLLPISAVLVNDEPKFATGNLAVVFKMRKTDSNQVIAVKCFHKSLTDRQLRQQHIAAYLEQNKLKYFVPYRYLHEELWVDTGSHAQDYPVVVMDWVEGKTLGETVKNYCQDGNTDALKDLLMKFCEMASYLLSLPIAHGDLKHDNILVTPAGELLLVDYDGMYVPSLQGRQAAELGGTDYQHPHRTPTDYNAHIDDYAIAVIALSLAALAQQPDLYTLQKGENLLLGRQDFLQPFDSEILSEIEEMEDRYVQKLLNLVKNSIVGQHISIKLLSSYIESTNNEILKLKFSTLTFGTLPLDFFTKDTTKVLKEVNGNIYIGELYNQNKHGKGIFKWANGDVYEGDWIDGKRTGKGIYKWANGDVYEGDFIDDQRTGKGIFKWANGDVYEGDFIDGKIIGKGICKWANGDVYEGDWIDGKRTGKGIYKWANGNVYEGDWIDGKRTGKGIFKWADGDVYEGDFIDDQRTGKGTYKWANGNVYEGDWIDGKRTGKGIFKWANGNVYEGDFVNGKRTGKGIFKWADGDVYEGDFINGQQTGKGIYKWANGSVYEGDFIDGKRTGKGIFKWANGDVYEGDWIDGQQTGKGILKGANGSVYEGDFVDGKITGKGILKAANGDVYEGDFVDGEIV